MSIERSLQIHIVILVLVSSALLWLVQSASYAFFACFAALTSFYFVDVLKVVRLNRLVANFLALAALVYCSQDFLQRKSHEQLQDIANLLILLQVVLFYQEKNQRIYWHLTILSLLQVVVVAAMQVGVEFGFLLLLYMAVAFSTLVIFLIYRELNRVEDRILPWRYHLATIFSRRPKIRPSVVTRPIVNRKRVAEELFATGFFRQIAGLSLATLIFTVVLFYSIPRVNSQGERQRRGQGSVGFSEEISLRDMGNLLQDETPALRIIFRDGITGAPQLVNGDAYLRGSVLTAYRPFSGDWRTMSRPVNNRNSLKYTDQRTKWTIDCTSLLQSRHNYFATFPVHRHMETPKTFVFDPWSGHVREIHDVILATPRHQYMLNTTAFENHTQLPFSAHQLTYENVRAKTYLYKQEEIEISERPSDTVFPTLIKQAAEVVNRDNVDLKDRVRVARVLQNDFRFSGEYKYTLNLSSITESRDLNLDPIEDFVKNHKRGHCQYFASALTLMLRSQGIPARIAVGFRTGPYNAVGQYYLIKQRYAHAWVEARFTREQALPYLTDAQRKLDAKFFWLRLDPTPASRGDDDDDENSILSTVDQTFDYAQLLWREYVVGARARNDPTQAPGVARSRTKALFSLLNEKTRNSFLIQFWIVTLIGFVCVILFGLIYQLRKVWIKRKQSVGKDQDPDTAFYRRAEKVLASLGIKRTPSQTQREFGQHVLLHGHDLLPLEELRLCMDQIVAAFYQVRFGKGLSQQQQASVNQAVEQLETMVLHVKKAEQAT